MTPPVPRQLYRLFRRAGGVAASVRSSVIALLVVAVAITAFAVVQVARRHEVVRLGYELARASERVREAEEQNRRLLLERATLSATERIRTLATSLGMVPTPPDQIRVAPTGAAKR